MALPGRRHAGRRRAPADLLGRRIECGVIDHFLDAVRGGSGRALVVRGEPGIGKTALLEYLVEHASGCRLARAAAVESEMEMAYAGLHQLLTPMLHRVDQLPGPQREALRTAFGLGTGSAPDRFLVGLATLSLLADVAEEHPLMCVVDDEQWLDRASAQVLGFVARRLVAEPVGLVFAARAPTADLAGLPELAVEGLADADARELLAGALTGPLDAQVTDRLVAESGGNPLALLELPRELSPPELAGGFALPDAVPLSGRIEDSFRRRLDALPAQTRLLLLVAAAEPIGDPVLVWRAAQSLGIRADAAGPAAETGLLEVGARVQFRHPLVRSAAYRSAPLQARQEVHRALAEATDAEVDPDRRAWHWAHAAPGPDEQVAAELERSASRAQARGGPAAAAAFLQRAVALTLDPARRTERAMTAAQASFQAGGFDAALALLATAEAGPLDRYQQARADLLRGHLTIAAGTGNQAAPMLLQAAKRLEPYDLQLARRAYLTAWGAAIRAGHLGDADVFLQLCRAVRALPPTPVSHPLDLLVDGFAMLTTHGRAAATPILQRAALALVDISAEDALHWGWLAPGASSATWDCDGAIAIYERKAQLVRNTGALGELPTHLQSLALERAWRGDFAGAEVLIAESDNVAAATGTPTPPFALLRLRALQGHEAEAAPLIGATIEKATATGQGNAVMTAHWAAAVLNNGLARYEEAMTHAHHVTANAVDPWQSMWALPELVEAASRAANPKLANDALEQLTDTTQPAGTDFALGIEARSRALLTNGPAAEDLYREGIERLITTGLGPEFARAHLLYGEWLRRDGRRLDARQQLRTAHDMFDTIGMAAFTERARRELAATGERARKRTPATTGELTPQEALIAQLARDGLSNPEIGVRLFLTARTVKYHLAKVFTKLDITSRAQLDHALPGDPTTAQPSR